MKCRYSIRMLITLMLLSPAPLIAQKITREEYIGKYKHVAIQKMKEYGIPASITLAQACLESDNGNSVLAVQANNHFGIKCHDTWTGEKIYHDDDAKGECFRSYKNAKHSFDDHSDFLRYRKRYEFLFDLDPKDYKAWASGLKKAGYATNPNYANMLIKIIEDNQLYKYDAELSEKEVASGVPRPSEVNKIIDIDHFVVMVGREVFTRNGVEYVIAKQNDTYYRIADEFGLSVQQIISYNDLIEKSSRIQKGDVIYIQPKRNKADKYHPIHIVEEGETMQSISQLYGIKMKALYKKNRMNMIEEQQPVPGQELYLRKSIK